jgi:uncharacterized protein (UPF0333 family)
MKKLIIGVIVIILIVLGVSYFRGSSTNNGGSSRDRNSTSTEPVKVSETTKVSSQLSEYQNSELGFSVKYPTAWEKAEADLGVTFIIPVDPKQVSTIGKLQADINVFSGKCSFPPVTTIKDRGTLKVGTETMNTISMTNTIQGRGYFNRMYSLQKDNVCYFFTFSSITLDPVSKKLTGSNIIQAQNNNKAIVTSADTAFTDMVKTFAFVVGPQGKDETQASPVK